MNKEELVKYVGYTEWTICKLIKEEGLPATRIRGPFRFKKDMVDRWLEERMINKSAKTTGEKE